MDVDGVVDDAGVLGEWKWVVFTELEGRRWETYDVWVFTFPP